MRQDVRFDLVTCTLSLSLTAISGRTFVTPILLCLDYTVVSVVYATKKYRRVM
jgi:hypothetical protein